jgi:predicted ATPase
VAHELGFLVSEPMSQRVQLANAVMRDAAYALISEAKRASIHLKIGRRIWMRSTLGTIDESPDDEAKLFDVASHLILGLPVVVDSDERCVIAAIQCRAGQRAMQMSDFATAVYFFDFGIVALKEDMWNSNHYDISLTLHNYSAEANYCIGDFDRMDERVQAVFANARNFTDKIQAYTTLVYSMGGRNHLKEAVSIAQEVLRVLGEQIPANPGTLTLLVEYFKTRWMLRCKSDRFFLSLPTATDISKIAAIQMLNLTSIYSYIATPKCGAVACFRILRLSVQYGMVGPAIPAYGAYGFLLGSQLGRMEEGYRYGQISLALLEQCQARAWLPRVYFFTYGLLNRWVNPLRESIEPLRRAYRSALATGDIEGGVITASSLMSLVFHVGIPLASMESEARSFCQVMDSMSQTMCLAFLVPRWTLFCDLAGNEVVPLNLTGDVTNSQDAVERAVWEGNKSAVYMYYINCTVYSCFCGDFEASVDMARKARTFAKDAEFGLVFYEGISALALAPSKHQIRIRRSLTSVGRRAVKQFKRWSQICPTNFRNKLSLLEAEMASTMGQSAKAIALFNSSIKAARKEGFVHEEALACERLALYHASIGNVLLAVPSFERAREAYQRWGSERLVRRMKDHLESCEYSRRCQLAV